jgi:sugar phosphate isomerase/epimerase
VKDGTRYDASRHGPREGHKVWKDGPREFICVEAGAGAVNHDGLLAALARDGYDGWFTLEPHVPHDRLDDVCRRTIDYLKRTWRGKG